MTCHIKANGGHFEYQVWLTNCIHVATICCIGCLNIDRLTTLRVVHCLTLKMWGVGKGYGYPSPQPTRGSGGASWAPPAGSGAEPRAPPLAQTHFKHILGSQSGSGRRKNATCSAAHFSETEPHAHTEQQFGGCFRNTLVSLLFTRLHIIVS